MQPPAQELVAKDLHDTVWNFRHIYRGTIRVRAHSLCEIVQELFSKHLLVSFCFSQCRTTETSFADNGLEPIC